jgi:RimJ/RimL family protein N-acetyltransferase
MIKKTIPDMPLTFKRATTEDIRQIQALARRIWDEAYKDMLSKEQIGYMLEMMYSEETITEEILKGIIWEIILYNDIPCGYISYASGEDNSVKLSKIYIDKKYRGKDVAEDSINRVLQYAAGNGKHNVFLTVNKKNRRAIRAYEKSGFTIAAPVITDIGNGFFMDDYVMKCFIAEA